jgi:pre-60S factor REI1
VEQETLEGVASNNNNSGTQTAAAAASSPETTAPTTTVTPTLSSGGGGLALTARAEKMESRFGKQLATLSAGDARSLAHLSRPEQRAALATRQRQVDKAARAEQRYRTRLEGLGNGFLMEHFVKDAADKRTLWR